MPPNDSCLLSPIDFDLSFTKKNFVNNDKQSNSYGTHDELIFDKYLNREINTLLKNIINSNENRYLNNNNEDSKENIKYIIYYLLNDSLIEYYMKTFDKIECGDLENIYESNNILRSIIKLCLISTYDRLS